MPIIATIGRSAFGHRVAENDVQAPEALGARGADEILAEHVEHRGAHHPRVPAGAEKPEGERRQHQMGEGAVAADREPAELDREDVEKQDADDELRRRDATKESTIRTWSVGRPRFIAANTPMVRPSASSQRIAPTIRSSVAGRREAISVGDLGLLQVGAAEVALRKARQVAPVLLVERQVEAELVADARDRVGRGAPAGDLPRRIGRQDVEEHEGDERDPEEDQHRLDQPAGEIRRHQ